MVNMKNEQVFYKQPFWIAYLAITLVLILVYLYIVTTESVGDIYGLIIFRYIIPTIVIISTVIWTRTIEKRNDFKYYVYNFFILFLTVYIILGIVVILLIPFIR
jgi:hypothetical protein